MFTNTYNPPNLYAGVPQAENLVPFCNAKIGDGVYHQINLPAKRLRDSPMATTSGSFSFLGEDLSMQMSQHQLEVDRLISSHMERVKVEIEERTKRETIRILQAIQEAVARKLTEKDEQIDKIGKLNWALQDRVKSICLENQIWRDLAQSNEATANALRSNIQQVLSQSNNRVNLSDDAESCCGSSSHGLENNEEDEVDTHRWKKVARTSSSSAAEEEKRKRRCRRCGISESCVLLLPCRHLCLCSACAPAVDACPVCNSIKNAGVHVNLP